MNHRLPALMLSIFLQSALILPAIADPRAQSAQPAPAVKQTSQPASAASPSAHAATAENPSSQPAFAAKIDALAAEHLARPGAAGLSIAVARDGKVLFSKGYGLADLEHDVPANEETMFPAELVARLSGDWTFTEIGLDAKVFERQGKLMLQATGQGAFRLMWQGEREFRADFDTDVRLEFAEDGKSVALHQNGKTAKGVRK